MYKARMEPGTYYIGDPSYITNKDQGYIWIEKLWDLFYKNVGNHLFKIDNVKLFIGSTYGGDGVYNGYYVDSGTIAIIKIDEFMNDEKFNFRNMNIKGASFITFNDFFTILYDNGNFNIGDNITIKTEF